jgi:diguanylate cyclase (GGDEF)-like protein
VARDDDLAGLLRSCGWELGDRLAHSPSSVVHRATREGDRDRTAYALKVMREGQDAPAMLRAFRREATMLTAVGHPGLPAMYEVGLAGSVPYLAMELLTGGSLADRLLSGPLPVPVVVDLAIELAAALAAAHHAGLVHRDVKPDNIVFDGDGRPRLIDFGLARAQTDTAEDGVIGTLRYTSPEQSGMIKRPVDQRSDLYACGAVLYECLVGEPPFTTSEVGELLRAHAVATPPLVSRQRPEVPPALAALVAKLLAKDPDDRYHGGDGLVADLTRIAAGEADFPLGSADDAASVHREPRLVGRAGELAALTDQWRQARGGAGRVVVVRGRSGSGKSRLLRELARDVVAGGGVVLSADCSPDGGQPYAVLREAVEGRLRELNRAGAAGADGFARLRAAAGEGAALVAALSPELARVLNVPPAAAIEPELFAAAVATFLLELARHGGGLLCYLNDVQWMDEASWTVMRRLATELAATPLLFACSLRTDKEGSAAQLERFAAVGGRIGADLALPELDNESVGALLADQLGGPLDPAFVARLSGFVRGSPFAAIEFGLALVNGGLISPYWGRSVVDEQALAQVDVASDVVDLITRQLDRLGPAVDVLATAAAIGDRFELDLLYAACPVSADEVLAAVSTGVQERLVEPLGREEYAFVHHRVRELLVGRLSAAGLRALHQRVARALDTPRSRAAARTDHRRWYPIAHHYAHGDLAENPRGAYEAAWAAARAALADHAVADALTFLDLAERAAEVGGFVPEPRFDQTAGQVRYAAGALDAAAERLTRALAGETDPKVRSELLELLARVEYARPDYATAMKHAGAGLAELGRGVPYTRRAAAWSVLLGAWKWLWYRVWPWRRQLTPAAREKLLAYLRFAEIAGRASYATLPPRTILSLTPHFLHAADRYGPSPEYVSAYVGASMLVATVDQRRLSRWLLVRAERVATRSGDPRLTAQMQISRGHIQYYQRDPVLAEQTFVRVLTEQIRWLPTEVALETMMALTVLLDLRGHSRASEQWRQRGLAMGLPAPTILFPSVVLGQTEEAEAQLRWADGLVAQDDASAIGRLLWGGIVLAGVNVHFERGDLGPDFDRLVAAYHRRGPTVRMVRHYWYRLFLLEAYGRLAQARQASLAADRRLRLEQSRRAVAELGMLSADPLLTGHWRVAQALLATLEGHPEEAMSRLLLADRVADDYDMPWVRFESLVARARTLQATGRVAAGSAAAEAALAVAERHGWVYRAARVRREFAVDAVVGVAEGRRGGEGLTSTGKAVDLRDRRYLDALLQVSTAASSVLDPRQLARVALDELLKILGAERAYLFACPSETAPLELYAGRDSEGEDLAELVGYSSTVVEWARAERRPLIVTGTDQGAAVGSQSAVAHGLRSIMVAPMQLDGRLLGIVYLDSRVAKGIFAAEDEEILVAISNQIASSLETARAAQLEVQVEAERRQRNLADQLREATGQLSRTLDPDEVLNQALALAADMVGADAGCVLLGDTSTPLVGACYRRDPDAVIDGPEVGAQMILPMALAASTGMVVGQPGDRLPEPLALLLGRPLNWLLVPLSARGSQFGMLALADRRATPISRPLAGIAAAFGTQAGIAYDNARLFRQVEQLATIDGLSNVFNRRHFMELAAREVATARRHDRPLAAIMLDIDHFKRVNDTYGHATGDQVIRVVAERLTASIRAGDLLGRYGGEEFVLLVLDGQAGATDLAERLRRAVEAEPVPTEDGPVPVTISVGVSTRAPGDDSPDSILARADSALYRAKRNGRNQVALVTV